MRVAQISDTHIFITSEGQIKTMLKEAAAEKPDLVIHCGDYCGGRKGHTAVEATVQLMRDAFPETPIITTIGNHDYWYRDDNRRRPTPEEFEDNYEKVVNAFTGANIHFLDTMGPYKHPDFPLIRFLGVSGWYASRNPPTNDANYLPHEISDDIDVMRSPHEAILKLSEYHLTKNMDELDAAGFDRDLETLIFISHFPVVRAEDYKGGFDDFAWSEKIQEMIAAKYGCRHFLNGHAHQLHKGPLRYECGADYYNPKYHIIEL